MINPRTVKNSEADRITFAGGRPRPIGGDEGATLAGDPSWPRQVPPEEVEMTGRLSQSIYNDQAKDCQEWGP